MKNKDQLSSDFDGKGELSVELMNLIFFAILANRFFIHRLINKFGSYFFNIG